MSENLETKIHSLIDDDYGRKIWQLRQMKPEILQITEAKKQELRYLESRKEDLDFEVNIHKKTIINTEDPNAA